MYYVLLCNMSNKTNMVDYLFRLYRLNGFDKVNIYIMHTCIQIWIISLNDWKSKPKLNQLYEILNNIIQNYFLE